MRFPAIFTLSVLAIHVEGYCNDTDGCTLSGDCVDGQCVCDAPWYGAQCQRLKLKPAKLAAPFIPPRTPNHHTWGCAPFFAREKYCFYFTWLISWDDGNETRIRPDSDHVSGSLGLACASQIEGPYSVENITAFPFRPDGFDASYIENPVLSYSESDRGYLLAYTTSPKKIARNTLNWEGNGGLQYMGVAFADDPFGPWERMNRTILMPKSSGFESNIAINPAVLPLPNGSIIVTYRGAHDDGYGNCMMQNRHAQCHRPAVNSFANDSRWVRTEDPFTYRSSRGYIMISHNFSPDGKPGAGTKAFSHDGLNWQWAGEEAYEYRMPLVNGTVLHFFRREEPKLLFKDGKPVALYNVVDGSFLYNDTRIIVQELDYSL